MATIRYSLFTTRLQGVLVGDLYKKLSSEAQYDSFTICWKTKKICTIPPSWSPLWGVKGGKGVLEGQRREFIQKNQAPSLNMTLSYAEKLRKLHYFTPPPEANCGGVQGSGKREEGYLGGQKRKFIKKIKLQGLIWLFHHRLKN